MHRSCSQAFPKKRLIQGGRRSVSGCLLAQTLEGSLTLMLMNCGAESHVCGGLRDGDSIARHAACSLHGLGETASQHGVSLRKTVWIPAPARDRRRRTIKGLFQPEMSVNQSMELSVEVLDNPLASWTARTITHQWSDVTHGFTPNGKYSKSPGKEDEKSNIQFLLISSAFSHPTICYLTAGLSSAVWLTRKARLDFRAYLNCKEKSKVFEYFKRAL